MSASAYASKPWLGRYPAGKPEALEREFESALAMFLAAASARADEPCIHYFSSTLTFGEVDALSTGLASGLLDAGLSSGDRLGVYVQNVPQFAIALVAGWKAGLVPVLVNPMLRGRELRGLMDDSGAAGIVCLESLWRDVARDALAGGDVRVVVTTSELDFLDSADSVAADALSGSARDRDDDVLDLVSLARSPAGASLPDPGALGPSDIAFLTYTSGTTGPPKGAMNTHENVVMNAQCYRDWLDLSADDVVLGAAPLFHITGVIGHVGVTFLCGAPLVLFHRFEPGLALSLIEAHGVTFTVCAITVFISLMNADGADAADVSSLRVLASGGAPVAPGTVKSFEERFGVTIHNIYGLTETTSPSHCVPLGASAPVDPESGALSVGVPVFGTVVRILGDDGAELPVGEVGEIATSGPQVVPGYWEKPEETAHALPDGELRTGDVGFMDADGWFYLVDRKKDQINAAGYKVWPREVEDVLYGHPAVREVAVVGVPDEYRGETVKAFVSLRADAGEVSEDDLIAYCKGEMAAYKYPRQVEFVDEIPKTASGKVLRRELRDREAAG